MGGATVHMGPVDRFLTEADIDHTAILNIGTNSHAAIDTHIALSSVHFTEASINITESQISDLQGYAILLAASNIFTSNANYNEFHVEDAGTIDNRGILIKNDLSSNSDGYSIVAGTTGLFDGALIMSDNPTDVVNNRSMQLVHNNAVIFGLGVKVSSSKSFADESFGALTYYAPLITGLDRAVMSFVNGSNGFNPAQFWWESYTYGGSGLTLRRFARFLTGQVTKESEMHWHGKMKFMDIADNQTNMGTANYLRIEADGVNANFVAVGAVTDFNFVAADSYNFDNYIQIATSTDAALNAVANAINTDAGKVQGAMLYNTDQDIPVYAVGNADADVWVDGAGTTVNTPVV